MSWRYTCQYSQTSVKQPPIKQPTFIWQPAAKVLETLPAIHCNKKLYSTATSIKWPWPASWHPKGNFLLIYTSIKWPGRFKVGHFEPDEGKRMWNVEMQSVIISLDFVNVMDHIITIIVLLLIRLHLFVHCTYI